MNFSSSILEALARYYEKSQAGQTGLGIMDVQPCLEILLAQAGCSEGDARELALRQLQTATESGLIALEPAHSRDRSTIYKVRLSPRREDAFYAYLGRPSPTLVRKQWSNLFLEARGWPVA